MPATQQEAIMERGRAYRRHQRQRAIDKTHRLWHAWGMERYMVIDRGNPYWAWSIVAKWNWIKRMTAVHRKPCSRQCCGNPRRHFGQPSLQERRHFGINGKWWGGKDICRWSTRTGNDSKWG